MFNFIAPSAWVRPLCVPGVLIRRMIARGRRSDRENFMRDCRFSTCASRTLVHDHGYRGRITDDWNARKVGKVSQGWVATFAARKRPRSLYPETPKFLPTRARRSVIAPVSPDLSSGLYSADWMHRFIGQIICNDQTDWKIEIEREREGERWSKRKGYVV